ncbi:glycerophosphodiester phosphodiesterase [Carboxylicivirga caseinilyticus]|uniref:glycerophosphodiester phosphodiesterase n=1 Tax=Carboxylicivirga caseinilyticus TaxID=3417572 RepID=UPI003D34A100|nr:hypothetical protein [Marinilabiliaceae bacterium A049]
MIIAHRGESFDTPENSLKAINKAWNEGAEAVEIDVHLTSDNHIAVIHDANTHRTGNRKIKISESTLKEIKTIDIGIKYSKKYVGERIPSLEEVFNTIPKNGKLIIEIKCDKKIIPHIVELLKKHENTEKKIEFIAFNLNTLSKLKEKLPNYKMLWLLDLDYYWPSWLVIGNKGRILRKLKKNNLDGINCWAGKKLNKRFIFFFKNHNYAVYSWTVNDPLKAKELLNNGIDAITTDRAAWLKQQLNKI